MPRIPLTLLLCLLQLESCGPRTRVIAVHVACDEEFRSVRGWEAIIRERLKAVSEIYDRRFNIRWQMTDLSKWNSSDSIFDSNAIAAQLQSSVKRGEAEVLLGVSGKQSRDGALGSAIPFTDTALVFNPRSQSEQESRAIVAHELAHLFGAGHSGDRSSVMLATPASPNFDDQAARMVRLMRDFDFRKGIDGIDSKTQQQISVVFQEGHSRLQSNPLVTAHTGLAIQLRSHGELQQAISHYRQATRIDPSDATARYNLGFALSEIGSLYPAIAEFREAVRLDPTSTIARESLALMLARAGQLNEAATELRECVRVNPKEAATRFNLGLILSRQPGQIDAAIAEFREALRLKPDYGAVKQALAIALEAKRKRKRPVGLRSDGPHPWERRQQHQTYSK